MFDRREGAHEQRERHGQREVAGRAGDGHDEALPPDRGRRRLFSAACVSLQAGHAGGIELGQGDVAAERDGRDAVLGAAGPLFPERRAEADGKHVGAEAEKLRRGEMPAFVDDDRESEEEDHAEGGEDPTGDLAGGGGEQRSDEAGHGAQDALTIRAPSEQTTVRVSQRSPCLWA